MKITKEQKTLMVQTVENEVANYIADLPQTVRKIMQGGVHSILGLSPGRWHDDPKWTVDNNNGRESILSKIVTTKCMENVNKFLPPIAKKAIEELATDEDFLISLVREAKDQFRRVFYNTVQAEAKAFAEKQAKLLMADLENLELTKLIDPNADIANPAVHKGKLGHFLAEHIAANMVNGIS